MDKFGTVPKLPGKNPVRFMDVPHSVYHQYPSRTQQEITGNNRNNRIFFFALCVPALPPGHWR